MVVSVPEPPGRFREAQSKEQRNQRSVPHGFPVGMRACGCAGGHAPAPDGTLLVPRVCMRRWQLRRRARNAADQVDEPRTVYVRDLAGQLEAAPAAAGHSPAVRRRTGERCQTRPRAASTSGVVHPVRRRTSNRRGQATLVLGPTPNTNGRCGGGCPGKARQRRRQHPNPHPRAARGRTSRPQYGARCGGGTLEPDATRIRSPA